MTVNPNETMLPPVMISTTNLHSAMTNIVMISSANRLLAFHLNELKVMSKGRGLQLISLPKGDTLQFVTLVAGDEFVLETRGKRGASHQETLRIQDIANKRGHKGKELTVNGSIFAVRSDIAIKS